jgi:DNA adenine methylase
VNCFLPRAITPAAPPLKTQGIKTRLTPFIAASIRWDGAGRWIEPFLGSAAVLLNIAPPRALVADSNEHVIRFYRALQDGQITPERVGEHLRREGAQLLSRGEEHYYAIRERFNASHEPLDLLFLNRACFNGIMRFNRSGEFNVPFCRKPERFRAALISKICNQVSRAAQLIKERRWEFRCQPWQETLAQARGADFVYLDPPYVGRHAGYFNAWSDAEAGVLATAVKKLPCGFAYSMWKENRYRLNAHLADHFDGFPLRTMRHFYHVGASERLRNFMDEALIVKPGSVTADAVDVPGEAAEPACCASA